MLTIEQRQRIENHLNEWKRSIPDVEAFFPPTNKPDSEIAYRMYVLKHMCMWITRELERTEKLAIAAGVQCDKSKQEHGPGKFDCWTDNIMRCTVTISNPSERLDGVKLVAALRESKVKDQVVIDCIQKAKVQNNRPYKFEYAFVGVPPPVEESIRPPVARKRKTKQVEAAQ